MSIECKLYPRVFTEKELELLIRATEVAEILTSADCIAGAEEDYRSLREKLKANCAMIDVGAQIEQFVEQAKNKEL